MPVAGLFEGQVNTEPPAQVASIPDPVAPVSQTPTSVVPLACLPSKDAVVVHVPVSVCCVRGSESSQ